MPVERAPTATTTASSSSSAATSRPHHTLTMKRASPSSPSLPLFLLPESFLWLCLGILLLAVHPHEWASWSAVALFGRQSFGRRRRQRSSSPPPHSRRTDDMDVSSKHPRHKTKRSSATGTPSWRLPAEPPQGLAILLLTSLWTLVRPVGYTSSAWVLPWVLATGSGQTWRRVVGWIRPPFPQDDDSWLTGLWEGALGLWGLWCHTAWQWYAPGKLLTAHFLADTLQHTPALPQAFTVDEWQIVIFLAAGVWLEWMDQIVRKRWYGHLLHTTPAVTTTTDTISWDGQGYLGDDCTTLVACAGTVGVAWATSWVVTLHRQRRSLGWTLAVLVAVPLLLVEVSLALVSSDSPPPPPSSQRYLVPRCVQWMVEFLRRDEDALWDSLAPLRVPRAVWVAYWGMVVAVGLGAAPTRASRVVARKWFHLVAILLFTPVTLYAPQLQSLGYAIGVATLMALEGVRPTWTALQVFYTRYLDPEKDGRTDHNNGQPTGSHGLVISHMALILGCAMPLWCYQMSNSRLSPFVPFSGILVLGVGDALGATVGKWYGRHRWSQYLAGLPRRNRRTVEGSMAMLVGQILFAGCLECWGIPVRWSVVGPTILFATLLEAWTVQMDNIILPLAFVAFMGLWEQLVAWRVSM